MIADSYSFTQSAIDRMKESLLFAASQGGNLNDCESLLEYGADIDWKGPLGDTSLIIACRRGHNDIIKLLIAYGANVNIIADDSLTALHIATFANDIDTIKLLLDAGAVHSIRTKDGLTAFNIARMKGYDDIFMKLVQGQSLHLSSSSLFSSSSSSASSSEIRLNPVVPSPKIKYNANILGVMTPRAEIIQLSPLTHTSSIRAPLRTQSSSSSLLSASYIPSLSVGDDSMDHHSSIISSSSSSRRNVVEPSEAYVLIGPDTLHEQNEATIGLRHVYEKEICERKAAELKVEAITHQNRCLNDDLIEAKKQIAQLQSELTTKETELNRYQGQADSLKDLSLEQCSQLEKELKLSLDNLNKRKEALISYELQHQSEQRLCVICVEKDKSVLLLPCRHLCLCEGCAKYDTIIACPLCRKAIVHRISVYS